VRVQCVLRLPVNGYGIIQMRGSSADVRLALSATERVLRRHRNWVRRQIAGSRPYRGSGCLAADAGRTVVGEGVGRHADLWRVIRLCRLWYELQLSF
jgi:hypothetical protein